MASNMSGLLIAVYQRGFRCKELYATYKVRFETRFEQLMILMRPVIESMVLRRSYAASNLPIQELGHVVRKSN